MLQNSFIFLDKIGHETEQKLWKQGIHTWNDFLTAKSIPGIGKQRKVFYDQHVNAAVLALHQQNYNFFAKVFPKAEHWRLYPFFKHDACFLDIETSGRYGDITLVGIFDGKETATFVKGKNLSADLLKQFLQQYSTIVTFNGSSFDLPVLERYYPTILPPHAVHIDLRHPLAKLGFTGGLKEIEKQLGITRKEEIADMNGAEGVQLWNMYLMSGEEAYLERLIAYNEADAVNLQPLAEFVYKEMKKKVFEEKIIQSFDLQRQI